MKTTPGAAGRYRQLTRDDASSEHYLKALNVLLDSRDYDALLVIHSPAPPLRNRKRPRPDRRAEKPSAR